MKPSSPSSMQKHSQFWLHLLLAYPYSTFQLTLLFSYLLSLIRSSSTSCVLIGAIIQLIIVIKRIFFNSLHLCFVNRFNIVIQFRVFLHYSHLMVLRISLGGVEDVSLMILIFPRKE